MLFMFGRSAQPLKAVIGIALIVIGIVVHHLVLAIIGGVLLVWGGSALLGSVRNRGGAGTQRRGMR
jgi:hypothetical protein